MTASGPILVTGAAGFIGSHVVAALARRGVPIVGLDNFDPYYERAIKLRNAHEVSLGDRWPLLEIDICDDDAMRRAFDEHKPVGVIHLAGKAGVRPSIADPAGYMHTNVTGTARVLTHAHRVGCSRVVVASSSSVYGNCKVSPFSEELDVSTPISPYAASKRACELLAHTHVHLTRQPVACLRFFTVYGPRQRPDLAISGFMQRISKGQPIAMFGDGTTARDYTFVDDIVQGVLSAYDAIPAHGFRVWNLGNNKPVSLRDMITAIERVVGTAAKIDHKPMQPGDVELTCADISRSQRELNYTPRTTFAEGLAKQWGWMREQAH
jgi:nucleoside-diphosphate-sugar epimerase